MVVVFTEHSGFFFKFNSINVKYLGKDYCLVIPWEKFGGYTRTSISLIAKSKFKHQVHTRFYDSVGKIVSRNQAIVIFVHLTEQICQSGFLMVHESQELQITKSSCHKRME